MSGLDNLNTRLNYAGGKKQESRMQADKLRALRKALIYSYQAATAILPDGREFRCLINSDKLKQDYDDKIISIPFEDICLNEKMLGTTTQGLQKINIKVGDVITWKETNTNWLVYLQRLEEDAYFRAEIRYCNLQVEINDTKYYAYMHGVDNSSILWHNKNKLISWNDLNYDATLIITKNEETEAFFHRFQIIKLKGKPYEVQTVDSVSTEGVIEIQLKEYFSNSILEEAEKEKAEKVPDQEIDKALPHIEGDAIVYPYDIKTYTIQQTEYPGNWQLSNNKARIISIKDNSVEIEITTGRSGTIQLIYNQENGENIVLDITIESL